MSSDSFIEEDILEQIDSSEDDRDKDGLCENDFKNCEGITEKCSERQEGELKNNEDITDNKTVTENNGEQVNSNHSHESFKDEKESHLETENKATGQSVDNIDKVNIAIINYSGLLAENVLQEALLINEVYTRDNINIGASNKEAEERDRGIRKHLFPTENGRIPGKESGTGYDTYLLDKLLRSKADPEEVTEVEGFDGNEEHFMRNKEETYPGLDCEDAYVKAELDRVNSAREISDKNNNQMVPGLVDPFDDKNNNQMVPGLVDPFDDNVLQTIHEDSELVIQNGFHDNQETPLHQSVEVKIDKLSDSEYIAEDEMSASDDQSGAVEMENKALVDENINNKPELVNITADVERSEKEVPLVEDEDDDEPSEGEPDCCEMTFKEKQVVVKAVRKGNIDMLEKLLEKKNADMGLNWYGENLLMVAIRSGQQEMAEFLIDNGIDWQHERKLVEVNENGAISVHKVTAREMAYDSNMDDLVELLDHKMNNLFPFVKPKPRVPRLRQPIAPLEPPPLDEGMREEFMIDPDEAKQLQRKVTQEYRQRQREIELENLEMMQRRRKGLASGTENESVHTAKSKHTCSDLNIIHDDISQVFGPDEGYGTMSPVSPHRHDFHVPEMKEQVSIRTTRAFHLKKAFIASKVNHLKRADSPDYPVYENNLIETVGSYNFESRRWHVPKSAPQFRNYSVESLQDQGVHSGLPFVHGEKRKVNSAYSDRKWIQDRRSKSAHDNISPYSQVAKLLEQSRLFSPVSRSSSPYFPAISNRKANALSSTKTRINYIYADRSSAKPKRNEMSTYRTDLLPKRKINC